MREWVLSFIEKVRSTGLKGFLLGGMCALVLILPLVGAAGLVSQLGGQVEAVKELVDASPWIFPVFIILGGVVIGLALVPSHFTSLAAGFLFGLTWGGVAALGAVITGTLLGYTLSRSLAQDQLRLLIDQYPLGRKLADGMIDTGFFQATSAIALARVPPQVPFALGNVLGASCRVPLISLLLGTLIGIAPRVLLVVWIGSELQSWASGAPMPQALWWAIGAAIVGFGGLTLWGWMLIRNARVRKKRYL